RQILAWQMSTGLEDSGQTPIAQIDGLLHAGLAAELEPNPSLCYFRVLVSHRRETERMVMTGVLFVSDANQRPLEQLYDRSEDPGSRESSALQVALGSRANVWQSLREGQ